jgi:hypothetical protein
MGRNNYWDEEAVAVDGAGLRCHVAWSVLLCCGYRKRSSDYLGFSGNEPVQVSYVQRAPGYCLFFTYLNEWTSRYTTQSNTDRAAFRLCISLRKNGRRQEGKVGSLGKGGADKEMPG